MKLLVKTFEILNLFLDHDTEMSLKELSRLSGLNKSTVRRIASMLVKYGYLNQREKRGKYSLGFRYFDFTSRIKKDLKVRDIAIPYLKKLTQTVNESTILAICDGGKLAITETFHANHTLRVVPDEGTQIPLHVSSLGKIILANMPESERKKYLDTQPLKRYTARTITNLEKMAEDLSRISREGIAIDDEEFLENIRSIAAAIKGNGNTVVGAIGIIGPSTRMTPVKIKNCIAPLKKCAADISRELGYQREDRQVPEAASKHGAPRGRKAAATSKISSGESHMASANQLLFGTEKKTVTRRG